MQRLVRLVDNDQLVRIFAIVELPILSPLADLNVEVFFLSSMTCVSDSEWLPPKVHVHTFEPYDRIEVVQSANEQHGVFYACIY